MRTMKEVFGQDAMQLTESWKEYINIVTDAAPRFPEDNRVKLAVLLENTKRLIDRAQYSRTEMALNETTSADIAIFKKYAFELVTAVYSSLVAEEIVSVQPLQSKVGSVYYLKYAYGTNKGKIPSGTTVFDARVTGTGYTNYTSETIEEEYLASSGAGFSGSLAYLPIRPGTVRIVGQDGSGNPLVVTDDGSGNLVGNVGVGVHNINYATGQVNVGFSSASASAITATYDTNFESNPLNAPTLDVKVEDSLISARPRRLRALYSFDSAYDLKMMHGVDLDQSLLIAGAQEIKHETDTEIMKDLFIQAGGGSVTWNSTPSQYVSKIDHKDSFVDQLVTGSNLIFQNTRRAVGNFIIAGRKPADIIESLGNRFKPSGLSNIAGPYIAGVLDGKWKVVKNPWYGDGDFLIGFKGDTFLEAGYIYAPYLPVFTTSLIMMDDMVGRRGFASFYGKKMLNPKLFVTGNVY